MARDKFTRKWIIDNSVIILRRYEDGVLTIRGLYYQLVAEGMTNSQKHYKRVVAAMTVARWDELVNFAKFSDLERQMALATNANEVFYDEVVTESEKQVKLWMTNYNRNRWENQPIYPEVLIEKKALEGVFLKPCNALRVGLGACKGYPSLTFLSLMAIRFKTAVRRGKIPVILYFGDFDPSGEDIPRSLQANLLKMGVDVTVKRVALMAHQVTEWELPPAPVKVCDSRAANWDGEGQVELDAVEMNKLRQLCTDAINAEFNYDLHDDLMALEKVERERFRTKMANHVRDTYTK